MDLLYQRYASPFSFMSQAIRAGRFTDFVFSFMDAINKEKDEEALWQYYLSRVYDVSFNDFKKNLEDRKKNQDMTERTMEEILKESDNILENFNPEMQGGEA